MNEKLIYEIMYKGVAILVLIMIFASGVAFGKFSAYENKPNFCSIDSIFYKEKIYYGEKEVIKRKAINVTICYNIKTKNFSECSKPVITFINLTS